MPKFFIQSQIPIDETNIEIHNEDGRHIRNVLRMRIGENLVVCDSSGIDHNCAIESFEKDFVNARIISRLESNNEPPFEIVVFQGLPKADKMEMIIQKCVELGASRIVPVACTRSIVKLTDRKDVEKKLVRWNKIAYEAAKQCSRSIIPEIQNPITFKESLNQLRKAEISFIPWECEDEYGLKAILKKAKDLLSNWQRNINSNQTKGAIQRSGANEIIRTNESIYKNIKVRKPRIAFVIGPEGGFDQDEIILAKLAGIDTVTLGKRILRTETVAPVVLAMILLETEL